MAQTKKKDYIKVTKTKYPLTYGLLNNEGLNDGVESQVSQCLLCMRVLRGLLRNKKRKGYSYATIGIKKRKEQVSRYLEFRMFYHAHKGKKNRNQYPNG